MTSSGRASAPILCATWALIWFWSSGVIVWPCFSVTNAAMAWPLISCVLPITAASATVGCSTSADSTSIVDTRWPETFMTSSIRPSSQK